MWLHKQITNHIVACTFKPQYCAYAHIQKTDAQVPYTMLNYQLIPMRDLELEKQIIFNPTRLSNHVQLFLKSTHIKQAEVRMSITGPAIIEKIIPGADIQLSDHFMDSQLKHLLVETTQFTIQNQPYTYLGGISRELLFQYQLFAIKHALKLSCITTTSMALLSAYNGASLEKDSVVALDIKKLDALCVDIPHDGDPLLMTELIGLCLAQLQ